MPGPTSKDTYIGRSKGRSLGAAMAKRAETLAADHPACSVCGQPMVCSQGKSNDGAHFACRPTAAAFAEIARGRKPDETCFTCWASIMQTGTCDHAAHEAAS